MVDSVLPGIYKIEVPLPNNPLKAINSYVIKGHGRNLVIDTGMNRTECREALLAGLAQINAELENTDFLITHYHIDHSGLASSLIKPGCKVYISPNDGAVINRASEPNPAQYWGELRDYAAVHGFPEELLEEAIVNHPGYKFKPEYPLEITPLQEGTVIRAGDYNFHCLITPGHTGGHACLYETERKILISGDHVLGDITPNISQFADEKDALANYLKSLDKVAGLKIDIVLPAHHEIFTDCQKRISQLKEHHLNRIEEVWRIVGAYGPISAYEIAARMTWDMRGTWEEFAVQQKWFAFGEAAAHIAYMHGLDRLVPHPGRNGLLTWVIM